MPKRHRRRQLDPTIRIALGIDASRRVGWARYYDERQRSKQLQLLSDAYKDRIDVLVTEFLALIDSVLHDRNVDAFTQAWHAQTIIDAFVEKKKVS